MYRINGFELFPPGGAITIRAATAPSSHSVGPSQPSVVSTVGGKVAIEPPSGMLRTHTWLFDGRGANAVTLLRNYVGSGSLVVIDTHDNDGTQLTNIVCILQWPEIKSANRRDLVESFSLVFQEITSQS